MLVLFVLQMLLLSTPHGALGTPDFELNPEKKTLLSTPHGALGTSFPEGGITPP